MAPYVTGRARSKLSTETRVARCRWPAWPGDITNKNGHEQIFPDLRNANENVN